MGGKNDDKVMSQVNEPWSGVRDFLRSGYKDAQKLYGGGAPQYYPGRQIAPMSGYSKGALDSMAKRGMQGSPLVDKAQGLLGKTLGGKFLDNAPDWMRSPLQKTVRGKMLNGNPHFDEAVAAATRPVIDQYTKTVIPGLESVFSEAGRFGSGAQATAEADAYGHMADQVGDISSQMAYQNYGDERNRQMEGLGLAYGNYGDERQRQMQGTGLSPMLAQQDYMDIDALGKAGQGFDQYNQANINADMQKWNFNQNNEFDWLSNYLGLLQGGGGMGGTSSQYQPGPNPFTSTFGGALSGAALGNMLFPGVGMLPGALLGGGGGLLGSLF